MKVSQTREQLVSAFLTCADHISLLLSVLSKYHVLGIVTSSVYLFSNYSLPLCAGADQSWEYKGIQDRHVPLTFF